MDINQNNITSILSESNTLLNLLSEFQKKVTCNEDNPLIKMGRFTIAKNIIPFLSFEDITKFRLSCKDINYSCSSTVALVAYYKSLNNKHSKTQTSSKNNNLQLKLFEDITNPDDVNAELETLKNIRVFLSKKLLESENVIRIFKNDIEYLRGELKTQNMINEKLSENLQTSQYELQQVKKENLHLAAKNEDLNRKNEEDKVKMSRDIENYKNSIKQLQQDKNVLVKELVNLKEIIKNLDKKNKDKSDALKSIREFFLSNTIFKIKNINELENEYKMSRENENINK